MAMSRGIIVLCLLTFVLCSLLVEITEATCGGDSDAPCKFHVSSSHDDHDDDIDDTYKIVNRVAIKGPSDSKPTMPEATPFDANMVVLGH
ncbi:hypothetical protein M5689_018606 [Euphorbia peplus]|nr:hypothetical protein M5689_018606 [Euphorbia peplus]